MYSTKMFSLFMPFQNVQIWKLENNMENWKYSFDWTQEERKNQKIIHMQFLMLPYFHWLMIQYL